MNYIKLFEAVNFEKFKEDFENFKNDINLYQDVEYINYILDELKDDLYDKVNFEKYNQSEIEYVLNLEYKSKVNRKAYLSISYYKNLIKKGFKLYSVDERYFYDFLEKIQLATNLYLILKTNISLSGFPELELTNISNILKGYINLFNKFDMKLMLSNNQYKVLLSNDNIQEILNTYCFRTVSNGYHFQLDIEIIKKMDIQPDKKELDLSEFSTSLISDFENFCNKHNINTTNKKRELKNLILKYGEESKGN